MVSPFHSEDPENGNRRSRREQSSGNDAARPPPRKVEAAFFMSGEETSVEETIVNKSLLYAVFFGLTASPAFADSTIPVGNGVTLLPSYDARLRYESVDQENGLENADALTVRVRAGLEIGLSENFAVLGEVEGTLAPIQDYNSTTNGKTDFRSEEHTSELQSLMRISYA